MILRVRTLVGVEILGVFNPLKVFQVEFSAWKEMIEVQDLDELCEIRVQIALYKCFDWMFL